MTNKEAMERGMAAVHERGLISLTKTGVRKAKPSPSHGNDDRKAQADDDAEAWNMLRHLSRIL